MKLFLYDKNDLQLVPFSVKHKLMVFVTFFGLGLLSFTSGVVYLKTNPQAFDWEKEVVIIDPNQLEFSEENLVELMKEWNVRFPHIVLAQSMLETNNYKSSIFKENHNLFGMKEAKRRVTISKGTNRNHAYYNSWIESLLDYGFYQSHYLNDIRTEQQYYNYLSQYYAEDGSYVEKIKKIVKEKNLKDKF
jgi:uncharacterized FlgJ-related protein